MSYEDTTLRRAMLIIASVIMVWFAIVALLQTNDLVNRKALALINSRDYHGTTLRVEPTLSTPDNLQPAMGELQPTWTPQ